MLQLQELWQEWGVNGKQLPFLSTSNFGYRHFCLFSNFLLGEHLF